MSAGRMRHYVRLLVPPGTDDGAGGQTGSWTDGHEFWCDIVPISAREQAIAGAIQSIATHRVRTYYDSRITATKRIERIRPTGATLQILGPPRDENGDQRRIEIDCAEVIST